MMNNIYNDSLSLKFHYGRCPSCDKIIAVPADTTNTHCCYCGEKFLSRAAIAFYGLQKSVSFTQYLAPADSISIPQKGEEHPMQNYEVPKMMTIREIAKSTGISEYGIRRMVKEGKIPSVNVGAKVLINYNKVCELINQGVLGY